MPHDKNTKLNSRLKLFFLFALCLAFGDAMSAPTYLERPASAVAFVYTNERPIDPFSIITGANDIVLSGVSGKAAWAAALDKTGTKLWEYTRPLISEDVEPLKANFATVPKFEDSTARTDGVTILCGQIPRPKGIKSPAIVSAIDKQGKLVYEKLLNFESTNPRSISTISHCRAINDGILVVGTIDNKLVIAELGASGDLRWTKEMPISGESVGALLLSSSMSEYVTGYALALTNYKSTYLYFIPKSGESITESVIVGSFFIAESSSIENDIFLIGAKDNKLAGNAYLLKLNLSLKIKTEVAAPFSLPVSVKRAFVQHDRTIVVFGSRLHSSGVFTGAVCHIDFTALEQTFSEITPNDGTDTGHINSVGRTQNEDEFFVANSLLAMEKGAASPSKKQGLTIYIIKVK